MRFAGLYTQQHKHNKDLDEYIINYKPNKTKELGHFLEECDQNGKEVVIYIDETFKDFKFIAALHGKFPMFRLAFFVNLLAKSENFDKFFTSIRAASVPYYFRNIATDWDTAWMLLSYEPDALIVGGALGFDLQRLSKVAKDKGVQLRAVPNMLLYNTKLLPAWQQFFIRPEDTDVIYKYYIDVYEIYGISKNPASFDVFYQTYAIDKKWKGKLADLVPGFDDHKLDNSYLMQTWGFYRSTCQKICHFTNACYICPKMMALANALNKKEKSSLETEPEK